MTTIATLEPVVVNVSPKTNWTFLAVTTSDGAVGLGRMFAQRLGASACCTGADARARCCRARSRATTDALVRVSCRIRPAVSSRTRSRARRSRRSPTCARSAARIFDRAISCASSPRAAVPGYANINRGVRQRTPAGFAAAARGAVAAGYRAIKLAPFDGVIAADAARTPIDARTRDGLDRVFAVRDAVGPDIAGHGRLPLALRRRPRRGAACATSRRPSPTGSSA